MNNTPPRTNTPSNNPGQRPPRIPTHTQPIQTPSYSRLFSRNLNTTYNFTNLSVSPNDSISIPSSATRYTNPPPSTPSTFYTYSPPTSISSTPSTPPTSTSSTPPTPSTPNPPIQTHRARIYTSAYNTTYGSSYRNPRSYNGNTSGLIDNIFDNILNNDSAPTHMDISIFDIGNQRQHTNNETTDETEQVTQERPDINHEESQQPGNLGNIFNLYGSIFNNRTPIIRHSNVFNNTMVDIQIYDENTADDDFDICTICIDKIKNYDITRKINKCEHVFHLKCSDRWFCEHLTCPICRQDIRENINEEENHSN